MVRDELQKFIQYNEMYKNLCGELLNSLTLRESTVAAFTRCGTNTGTAFLSQNFTRIFGYARKLFIAGDLQFLIKHLHPEDLQAFISFAETSTLNAIPWNDAKEKAVHGTPSGLEKFFKSIDDASLEGSPDKETFVKIMRAHHIEPA